MIDDAQKAVWFLERASALRRIAATTKEESQIPN
jgi:hypothetical protein